MPVSTPTTKKCDEIRKIYSKKKQIRGTFCSCHTVSRPHSKSATLSNDKEIFCFKKITFRLLNLLYSVVMAGFITLLWLKCSPNAINYPFN